VAEHLPAGRRFMQRRDWLQLESRLQELPVHRRGSALRIGRWYESFVWCLPEHRRLRCAVPRYPGRLLRGEGQWA